MVEGGLQFVKTHFRADIHVVEGRFGDHFAAVDRVIIDIGLRHTSGIAREGDRLEVIFDPVCAEHGMQDVQAEGGVFGWAILQRTRNPQTLCVGDELRGAQEAWVDRLGHCQSFTGQSRVCRVDFGGVAHAGGCGGARRDRQESPAAIRGIGLETTRIAG